MNLKDKMKALMNEPLDPKIQENIDNLSAADVDRLAKDTLYVFLTFQRQRAWGNKFDEGYKLITEQLSDALHNIPSLLNDPEELKEFEFPLLVKCIKSLETLKKEYPIYSDQELKFHDWSDLYE